MKFRLIYPTLGLALGAFMISNASGPSQAGTGNKTGAPASTGTCSGCHSGGNFTGASISLTVKNPQNQVVTSYTPGVVYTVELRFNTQAGSVPNGYGFQVQAVATTTSAITGALIAGNTAQQRVVNGLIEHKNLLTTAVNTFTWTAPSSNVGNVQFYAAGLGANGNGGTVGDQTFTTTYTLTNGTTTSVEETLDAITAKLYPVPAAHTLNAEFANLAPNTYTMEIINLNGQVLSQKQLDITSQNERVAIPVETLASGLYALRLSHAGAAVYTQTFMKQ